MEKKKVRQIYKRRQLYETLFTSDLCKEINEITGFSTRDINEVVRVFFELMIEKILKKKCVNIIGLGRFTPVLKPPRIVNSFNKDKTVKSSMRMKETWGVNFRISSLFKEDMKKVVVDKKDIDNLYE